MIEKTVQDEILKRIENAQKEHNVKVLYAIESGSRAWGFASTNSDYDVRFIYTHQANWYLSVDLEERRDVIEYPIVDEIDINGWDVRKALKLLAKSNPSIIEWLYSPIIYCDDGYFANAARNFVQQNYSTTKGIYHYRSMAKTNYRGYLRKDIVPLKKYFYALRPLLAVKWLEQYREPAPIEFDKLRQVLKDHSEINDTIDILLNQKMQSKEKDMIARVDILNTYIESELARLDNIDFSQAKQKIDVRPLNQIFSKVLSEY